MEERCKSCDRETCPGEPFEHVGLCVALDADQWTVGCPGCDAEMACGEHRVDWRSRALEAEADRDRWRADYEVLRSQLRDLENRLALLGGGGCWGN